MTKNDIDNLGGNFLPRLIWVRYSGSDAAQ